MRKPSSGINEMQQLKEDVMILSLCYEILIVVLSLFFLCCYFSLSTFHP